MNESSVGFCCNTVNIFPVIISNIVTEVGRGLENRIIENNFSHKESFDKKQMKGISTTECILTRRQQEKKLRFKIMLNPQYNGAARRVQSTTEERILLIVS